MRGSLLLTVLLTLATTLGFSQSDRYWSANFSNKNNIVTDKSVSRQSFPKEYKLFTLNGTALSQTLYGLTNGHTSKHSTIISLPNADGQLEDFEVFEASNFDLALQAKFPEIRAFSGKGITDKYATLKLSLSPQGIQTMVFRTEKEDEFIEAYSKDHSVYACYKSQRVKGQLPWSCSTVDTQLQTGISSQLAATNSITSSAGELKTMRLAQSVTAEYSNYFGATSPADLALVLAAINATLTRCNGVYEKDLALHLNLIPNEAAIIYYDPATDPYSPASTGAGGAWNGQLQSTLTSVIGDANYDIGHLFGASGGGGNAGCIGCVCGSGKGSGFTSPSDGVPKGDNFDIDYVVHEVGHQLGANHTFTFQSEGGSLSSSAQREVGSGITIMGYAGITGYDVAPHSIDIYHEISIQQIQNNLATKSCPVTTNISANNATPVVAPVNNYTIPITTPFALTGSATDANAGDVLTYCWEQNDPSTSLTGSNSVASPTKASGPNWLSFKPTISPTRTFPILATILAGNSVTNPLPGGDAIAKIEALSSVDRTLNFRLTVRDNAPYSSVAPVSVGQTAFTDMTVTVSSAVGPFLITSQNSAVSYPAGSTQAVTWSVNGTNGAPTNTANVKISWSSDGGLTFPTVLAASTPNDGSENIVIPSGLTTKGRIKVEAIGNIYFDINNSDITVVVPPNDFVFGTTTPATVACPAASNPSVTIPTSVTGTFTTPIVLTATLGIPSGASISFSPSTITPGSSTVVTLNNAGSLSAGTYNVTITGTAGASVHSTIITYIISAGTAPVITTQPVSASVCDPATASFTVASSTPGVSYQWQSAPSATGTFINIIGATSASYTTGASTGLNGTVYHAIVYTQCATITSSNATLTVNTAASISTQPSDQSACTGNTATFTVSATGTGVTYQWQSSATLTGTYTNVAVGTGGNTNTYTTEPLSVSTNRYYRVIVSTTACPASITSNDATLTTRVTTAINTQPTAQTVCAPGSAIFSVAAVGTGATYQWQVSTAAAPATFVNVSSGTGANTDTYNTGATTASMNGNNYRVIVTGSCNTVTSNAVQLTVNTAPAISAAPQAVTICSGSDAVFNVTANGTALTYAWQSSTSFGGTYTAVPGAASSATLTIPAATAALNGTYYRVVISGTCTPAVTSTPVLLTVNTAININTNTTDASVCYSVAGPNNSSFSVAATGTAASYQWQVSTDGQNYTNLSNSTLYSGTNTSTLSLTGITLTMNGYKYRVLVSGTCTPAGVLSNAATLTVLNPVVINANPVDVNTCAGNTASFTVDASGSALTYQWLYSADGVSYIPVSNGASFSGATTPTLTISNLSTTLNNYRFKVVVTGTPCGVLTSTAAKLTANANPTTVLTLSSYSSITPSTPTVLQATVSPAANYTYQYIRDGITTNLSGATVPLNVDLLGSYQVIATNAATGCFSKSNTVIVKDSASTKLFVYPNPSSGIFQVRYYNPGNPTERTLIIYDSKGSKAFMKKYPVSARYEKMYVNMSNAQHGLYFIELRDANGKLMASGKVTLE